MFPGPTELLQYSKSNGSLEPVFWEFKNFSGEQAVEWSHITAGKRGKWHYYLVIKRPDQNNLRAGSLVHNAQRWHFFPFRTTLDSHFEIIFTYLKMCVHVCVKYAMSTNHFGDLCNLLTTTGTDCPSFWMTMTLLPCGKKGASTMLVTFALKKHYLQRISSRRYWQTFGSCKTCCCKITRNTDPESNRNLKVLQQNIKVSELFHNRQYN